MFLGYNQYWPDGLMVCGGGGGLCPGAPAGSTRSGSDFKVFQKTGPRLKVSSDRVGGAGFEPATLVLQGITLIHYSTVASQMHLFRKQAKRFSLKKNQMHFCNTADKGVFFSFIKLQSYSIQRSLREELNLEFCAHGQIESTLIINCSVHCRSSQYAVMHVRNKK